ncbi:MAG: pyruvate kinase [Rhodospirillales bacterium]|nr:pyruvate kinase [Rhodospirillales bacterium]
MNKTRILATIGPKTNSAKALTELAEAGMNVARLNGSHADLNWHDQTIDLIRDTLPGTPILLDIPGKKIRTIQLANEPTFKTGEEIILTTEQNHDGSSKVPVNNLKLHESLKPGHTVLADDGTLRFTVVKVEGQDIHLRAETDGTLRSRKGINVPFVKLPTELVTDKDREMMKFAVDKQVDFIGLSFVESATHVDAIKELTTNGFPKIIAKIENQGGIENMAEVITAADAIMIDRGDLSVETNLENMAVFQKTILKEANKQGMPVIVATEMLHTMIENPFPTKAEVSDITNAVMDGCAATMLSGETAMGNHPVEAVKLMRGVLTAAEAHQQTTLDMGRNEEDETIQEATMEAVILLARKLPITKIVVITKTGFAARMVATHAPRQSILAISDNPLAARSFNLFPGTEGFHVDIPFQRDTTDHIVGCLKELWLNNKITDDDLILVTAVGYPKPGNLMNLIQTHHVSDLVEALAW